MLHGIIYSVCTGLESQGKPWKMKGTRKVRVLFFVSKKICESQDYHEITKCCNFHLKYVVIILVYKKNTFVKCWKWSGKFVFRSGKSLGKSGNYFSYYWWEPWYIIRFHGLCGWSVWPLWTFYICACHLFNREDYHIKDNFPRII